MQVYRHLGMLENAVPQLGRLLQQPYIASIGDTPRVSVALKIIIPAAFQCRYSCCVCVLSKLKVDFVP